MKTDFQYKTHDLFCTDKNEVYINSDQGIFKSFDNGITWINYQDIIQQSYCILQGVSKDGNYLYLQTIDSLIRMHKDSLSYRSIMPISGVWRLTNVFESDSNNFALNWGQIIMFDHNWLDSSVVFESDNVEYFNDIVKDSEGILFAGSTHYMDENKGGVHISTDDGYTWSTSDLTGYAVSSLALDTNDVLFAGTIGRAIDGVPMIIKTTDHGDSWEAVNIGNFISALAINKENMIFAGTDGSLKPAQLLYSNDEGVTWFNFDDEIGGAVSQGGSGGIYDIAVTSDGFVFLATEAGVYRSINSTTGIEEGNSTTKNFELHHNYPNPFNNETLIQFILGKTSEVELSIFDSKGELVQNLISLKLNKGDHEFIFKADNLNSAVYFYRLSVDGVAKTGKMLYLK